MLSGISYVKWSIPFSTAVDHRGRTQKSPIKDHKVVWDYERTFQARLTIDKNNVLQGPDVQFEVIQEYYSGSRGERITLGTVKLDLAEYVEGADGEGEEGISRRYLMRDSKINSTLKIAISMRQLDGDRTFIPPALKTAHVFGGIAGIAAVEPGDHDDSNYIPSLVNKSREIREMQDMYRRTLVASWSCQAGQLPADECIENIFAGGNGWRDKDAVSKPPLSQEKQGYADEDMDWVSDVESPGRKSQDRQKRQRPGRITKAGSGSSSHGHMRGAGEHGSMGDARSRSAPHWNGTGGSGSSGSGGRGRRNSDRPSHEIDEADAREDLRCWSLPSGN